MPLTLPNGSSTEPTKPLASSPHSSHDPPAFTQPPISLAFPLTISPHTTLRIQITPHLTTALILLTTTNPSSSSTAALGSFVYAMPNRFNPAESLCTTLYSVPSNVDFATRVAKIVAKKIAKPVYVGCSVAFGGLGGEMEEEMEGMRVAVEGVLGVLRKDEG